MTWYDGDSLSKVHYSTEEKKWGGDALSGKSKAVLKGLEISFYPKDCAPEDALANLAALVEGGGAVKRSIPDPDAPAADEGKKRLLGLYKAKTGKDGKTAAAGLINIIKELLGKPQIDTASELALVEGEVLKMKG